MKLTIPAIQVGDGDGFSADKDIFSRKDFGERLANLVSSTNEELVVAIDAQWGEGKSTFIKMWKGYICNHREPTINSIYFDAFSNDYKKDPFIAISGEIYKLLKDETKTKKDIFIKKASGVAKSIARGSLKLGVRIGTSGVLDGSVVDSVKGDLSSLLSDQVDLLMEDRLKNAYSDEKVLASFREYLSDYVLNSGNETPLVFIVDELDRCRPDFALDLIEQIKHFFSVPGIVFLLVMNRSQLEEAIKTRYGGDSENAERYLQKFVHIWLSLPRKSGPHSDDGANYLNYLVNNMLDEGEEVVNKESIAVLKEVVKYYKLSFRDIERILSHFALIQNMEGNTNYLFPYQVMVAFICYVKVINSRLVVKIANGQISSKELIAKVNLNVGDDNTEYQYLSFLKKYIVFDLADDEEKKNMIAEDKTLAGDFGRSQKDVMRTVCGWMADIHRQT